MCVRVCVVGWGREVGLLIPTRLRSRVRVNRHSKIKELQISGTELIGEDS